MRWPPTSQKEGAFLFKVVGFIWWLMSVALIMLIVFITLNVKRYYVNNPPWMFFIKAVSKSSKFSQENISGGRDLKVIRKASLLSIYHKFIFSINTTERCTNANLKISVYVCVHIKKILWKFRILNPKNSQVIAREVCKFLKK